MEETSGCLFQLAYSSGSFLLALSILGVGFYLTVKTGFFQARRFVFILRHTLLKRPEKIEKEKSNGDISSFQALTTALAATVGTGNIAGVATAISLGGPGAVFWMWISAFLGMMLKFSEIALSVVYRRRDKEGNVAGGSMYVLAEGMRFPAGGFVFALCGSLAALGTGNMVQANTVAKVIEVSAGVSPWYTAVILALLTGMVILGGIKRVGVITSYLVPLMTLVYLGSAVFILISYRYYLLEALGVVLEGAFAGTAAAGGFAGAGIGQAVRYGVTRGIFTNEAGLGSAAMAHSAARTAHPVRQGMWGIIEVFIDTHLVCTVTVLALLLTGAWSTGLEGASMTVEAFNRGLPGEGGLIVTLGLVVFSFSTLISWSYYGEKCFQYIFPSGSYYYRYFWVIFVIIGAVGGLRTVWAWADMMNVFMALPNLLALAGLSGLVVRLIHSYSRKSK